MKHIRQVWPAYLVILSFVSGVALIGYWIVHGRWEQALSTIAFGSMAIALFAGAGRGERRGDG